MPTKNDDISIEELVILAKKEQELWAKRVNATCIYKEDNGNIEYWEYGKSYSKQIKVISYITATHSPTKIEKIKSFQDEIQRTKKFALERLKIDWKINEDEHLPISKSECAHLFPYVTQVLKYKEDDVPGLLSRMVMLVDLISKPSYSEDIKLHWAMLLGQTIAFHDYTVKIAPKNKKIASESRKPEIQGIIKSLAKNKEEKISDLWDKFKDHIENGLEGTIENMPGNLKVSKVKNIRFTYLSDNGKEKSDSMTFSTFRQNISRARKELK